MSIGGVDVLVFPAGVDEHASGIRAYICRGLQCLGLGLDLEANTNHQPDADISLNPSPGGILIIRTREDLTMLREVKRVPQNG